MEMFEPISLERQAEYLALLRACPARTSDYSFGNLWGWAEHYGLEWSFRDGLVLIRQNFPEPACWAPVGDWRAVDWSAHAPCLFERGRFERVPDLLADLWRESFGERVEIAETREHWDYVYSVNELVELKGNRFHKKKNLLKQFLKTYGHEFKPMGPDCVEEALQLQDSWCMWRDCESSETLVAENTAIYRVLQSWDRIPGLVGGTLVVDGRVAAYAVGEPLDADTLVVHFEKGASDVKGVYQAVNNLFLARCGLGFSWVNREQDLGDEGLRQAKMSYNPSHFMKKCRVSFR